MRDLVWISCKNKLQEMAKLQKEEKVARRGSYKKCGSKMCSYKKLRMVPIIE
jgi:hypothetical protein